MNNPEIYLRAVQRSAELKVWQWANVRTADNHDIPDEHDFFITVYHTHHDYLRFRPFLNTIMQDVTGWA
ncbi:MAG: hypothetical protein V2I97_10770 [Desulfococcaceae bacterium]|jgi:hypothetical protein|nr:hypothetical protein [Desulfococcaceae bacterium]